MHVHIIQTLVERNIFFVRDCIDIESVSGPWRLVHFFNLILKSIEWECMNKPNYEMQTKAFLGGSLYRNGYECMCDMYRLVFVHLSCYFHWWYSYASEASTQIIKQIDLNQNP